MPKYPACHDLASKMRKSYMWILGWRRADCPEWLTCVKQRKQDDWFYDRFILKLLFIQKHVCVNSVAACPFCVALFCTFAAKTWQAANDHHGCTLISTAPRHHVATRALKIQIKICVWSIHVKDFACNFLADWVDWWLLATNRKTSNWVNVSSSLFWQNLSLGQVSDVK